MSAEAVYNFLDKVQMTRIGNLFETSESGDFWYFQNSMKGCEKLTCKGKKKIGQLPPVHHFNDLFPLHVANLKKMDFAKKECFMMEDDREQLKSYKEPNIYPKWAFLFLNVMCSL